MKIINNTCYLFGIMSILALVISSSSYAQVKKAYKLLDQNTKLDKAEQYLSKSLMKNQDEIAARFGLARLFANVKYPYHNPDKAYDYILQVEKTFARASNQSQLNQDFNISVDKINALKNAITIQAYQKTQETNTLKAYEDFLALYKGSSFQNQVEGKRNALAFAEAQAQNNLAAYENFIKKYGASAKVQNPELYQQVEELIYVTATAPSTSTSYQDFIKKYPQSPYLKQAQEMYELRLFEEQTAAGTYQAYKNFYQKYPNSPYREQAESLAFGKVYPSENIDTYKTFLKDFPNGKFQNKVKTSLDNLLAQESQKNNARSSYRVLRNDARFRATGRKPRILEHPTRIKTERVAILNSTYRETNLNISPDGNYLYFMSGRGQMPWSDPGYTTYKGRPEHDGDIWYSQKAGGKWKVPRCLSGIINTRRGEDEPNISPDGRTVYFQSWRDDWKRQGGPYFQAERNGRRWTVPKGLGGGITRFFRDLERKNPFGGLATDGATVSADGNTFIVAAGTDYQGNMNLYISRKTRFGQWSYLKRLSVSTYFNERSPFLSADGKTLYFASNGYGGRGGLDIFKTVINSDDSHGEIVNIGEPFNTWLDDYGFILTADGDEAYFVREGDIYFADTKEADPDIKPFGKTLIVEGRISDAETQGPTLAKILIRDANTNKILAEGQSNASNGMYSFKLPPEANNFIQEVSKEGYQGVNKPIQVNVQVGMNRVISNIALQEIKEVIAQIDLEKEVETEAAAAIGLRPEILK